VLTCVLALYAENLFVLRTALVLREFYMDKAFEMKEDVLPPDQKDVTLRVRDAVGAAAARHQKRGPVVRGV